MNMPLFCDQKLSDIGPVSTHVFLRCFNIRGSKMEIKCSKFNPAFSFPFKIHTKSKLWE